MSATLDAVIALEFQFSELDALLDAFQTVAGENLPSWLSVVRAEFSRLESVLESVSSSARADLGGMGAVATMETQKPWTPSPGRVPSPSPAVVDAARTDKPETFTYE